MKLIKIENNWLVDVADSPHMSRVFNSKYAAILYIRKLEEKAELDALNAMGIGC